jgi:mono/diheme cytochrome c family protein
MPSELAGSRHRPALRRAAALLAMLACCASAAAALAASAASATAQPPAAGDGMAARPATAPAAAPINAELADRGGTLFRSSCGFCHGAEGGGASGPALVRSPFFADPDSGKSLAAFLKTGKPAAGMPPFVGYADIDIAAIHAYVRASAAIAPLRAAMDPASILVGNAAAGRAYFEGAGHCTNCHAATGDLRGVGSRYDPVTLQGRLINPRVVAVGRGGHVTPPAQVRVTMPGGKVIAGRLVQVNDFFVTLVDAAGVRRTIGRDNDTPHVVIDDPVEAHRQMMLGWQDRNMWDVTAYLASLK